MYRSNPFKEELKKALEPVKISFHVPGHKYGQTQMASGYEPEPHFRYDTTEIPGTDNLHEPEGLIRDAQKRASDFYGSRESFFLVNGTTAGILAMILASIEPGDTLLMGRDCHQSAYHGAYLTQAKLRWLVPEYDPDTMLNLGIRKEQVEDSLKRYPEIKAVVLTYPTYFGICSDIKGIAQVCRTYGVLLLVDEAHGAHFPLSALLPVSALEAGADICVQSTHKSLSALTQSSMLHVGSERVDLDKLRWMLRMVQTSSPSYLLMQSLDQAVSIAAESGDAEMTRLYDVLHTFREKTGGIPGLKILGNELITRGAVSATDFTKIIINPCGLGVSGAELSEFLRNRFGIQMELSTPWYSLGIASIGNRNSDIEALGMALESLAEEKRDGSPLTITGLLPPMVPETVMEWREALGSGKKQMPLDDSIGAVAGAMITPYPPGIPVLMPGERISRETVEYLQTCRKVGISVIGLQGPMNDTIQVVEA